VALPRWWRELDTSVSDLSSDETGRVSDFGTICHGAYLQLFVSLEHATVPGQLSATSPAKVDTSGRPASHKTLAEACGHGKEHFEGLRYM
jgi:hypothetical protein